MATTLRYGEELVAGFPDNAQGLITAEAMRDTIVSQRSGGAQITDDTGFTAPITAGVPTQINPILPSPTISSGLWAADGNNRLFPNYAAVMSGLTIPAGYSKFAQVFFNMAVLKQGSGEDAYLFQLDNNGTPIGAGVTYTLSVTATVVSFLTSSAVTLDGGALLGLTVTGVGTGDDIDFTAFEQVVVDYQIWGAP